MTNSSDLNNLQQTNIEHTQGYHCNHTLADTWPKYENKTLSFNGTLHGYIDTFSLNCTELSKDRKLVGLQCGEVEKMELPYLTSHPNAPNTPPSLRKKAQRSSNIFSCK
jgi:hypothetical protein